MVLGASLSMAGLVAIRMNGDSFTYVYTIMVPCTSMISSLYFSTHSFTFLIQFVGEQERLLKILFLAVDCSVILEYHSSQDGHE